MANGRKADICYSNTTTSSADNQIGLPSVSSRGFVDQFISKIYKFSSFISYFNQIKGKSIFWPVRFLEERI